MRHEIINKWVLAINATNDVVIDQYITGAIIETNNELLQFESDGKLVEYASDNGIILDRPIIGEIEDVTQQEI